MDNMKIYKDSATVPQEALKEIVGGRLKGMSDINPMWRIKKLTELFGPCGFGWWYEIVSERLEKGIDEVSAFVTIKLYVKVDGEVSQPIIGLGGSSFIAKERNGMYQSDECFKMALTDAIGTACKALGMAADVYYSKDRSKYDQPPTDTKQADKPKTPVLITPDQCIEVNDIFTEHGWDLKKAMKERWKITTLGEMTVEMYNGVLKAIAK